MKILNYKNLKKIVLIFFIIISLLIIYFVYLNIFDQNKLKTYINKYLWPYTPLKVQAIIKITYSDKFFKQFQNDYNVKFIPETQSIKVNFNRYKLDFLTSTEGIYNKNTQRKSFFIELLDERVLIIDIKGNIFQINKIENLESDIKKNNFKKISINIKPYQILDSFISDNKIYLSYASYKDKCFKFQIDEAIIDEKFLNFKEFFKSEECLKSMIQGGRIQKYSHNNQNGILFTVGDSSTPDFIGGDAQSEKSIFGKVLFKSLESKDKKEYLIFSKGHRNPQGLLVFKNDKILSTEHGPRGGDEINRIFFKGNYGWPISSYGQSYFDKNLKYKKNHSENGFIEPVFSFIPSIGISEIIYLPENFSESWQDNFLLTSLNGKSVYRIKFSKDLKKIIYKEKIFIGDRIRDIKYSNASKLILLALEGEGEIGIIARFSK